MSKLRANILFCVIMFHFAMVMTVLSPLLIEISQTYSLNMAQAGWIFTLNFLGFVFFVFFGGILADHLGKKTVMLGSLTGFALSLMLVILSPNFIVFCVLIFFIGGFGGVIEGVLISAVAETNDVNVSFYQNMVQIFFGLGALVGPVSAGLLVTAGMNWKACFLLLGISAAVISIAFAATKIPNKPVENGFSFTSFTELLRDPKFLLICLCIFLYTGSEVGSWGWMSTFLKQNLGFSIAKASVAVGLFWISLTTGRFICGQLLLRFKPSNIVIVLAYFAFAVTLSPLFITSEILSWIQIALLGFALSSLWPMIVGYGGEHRKSSSSTVFSVLVGCGGIGGMVIPNLMGLTGALTNAKIPVLIPSLSLLAVGIFFTFFKKADARKTS